MRTTLDLPDDLLRRLKAKAALERTTLKALFHAMVESELGAPAAQKGLPALPSIKLGRPFGLAKPTNASLYELLGD